MCSLAWPPPTPAATGRRGLPPGHPGRHEAIHIAESTGQPRPDWPSWFLIRRWDGSRAGPHPLPDGARLARSRRFYAEARAKGAQFLTQPLDRKAELRCHLRDPDGYLIEVGQATGMLDGVFADPPAGSGSSGP